MSVELLVECLVCPYEAWTVNGHLLRRLGDCVGVTICPVSLQARAAHLSASSKGLFQGDPAPLEPDCLVKLDVPV